MPGTILLLEGVAAALDASQIPGGPLTAAKGVAAPAFIASHMHGSPLLLIRESLLLLFKLPICLGAPLIQ